MPEQDKHLVHFVQSKTLFALLQVADKPESNPGPGSEILLGQSQLFTSGFYKSDQFFCSTHSMPDWIWVWFSSRNYTSTDIKLKKMSELYLYGYRAFFWIGERPINSLLEKNYWCQLFTQVAPATISQPAAPFRYCCLRSSGSRSMAYRSMVRGMRLYLGSRNSSRIF